jgi:hypothetical protein
MQKPAKARAAAANERTGALDVRESRDEFSDRNARFHTPQ